MFSKRIRDSDCTLKRETLQITTEFNMVFKTSSRHLGLPASEWVWLSDVTEATRGGWLYVRRSNVRVVNEVKVAGKLSRTLPVAPFADFHIPGSLGGGGLGRR